MTWMRQAWAWVLRLWSLLVRGQIQRLVFKEVSYRWRYFRFFVKWTYRHLQQYFLEQEKIIDKKNLPYKKARQRNKRALNSEDLDQIARRLRWFRENVLTWPWGLLAITLVGLSWLGVWGMLGAVFDSLESAFEAVEDIAFETLTASGKVEAFRNLLWGLSIAAGAAVAAITLGFSAWRTAMETRRVNVERRKAETETFATAIDHLDGGDLAKRLGAIRNLETLAAESPRLHPPIMETFCAYLREKSRERVKIISYDSELPKSPANLSEFPKSPANLSERPKFPADLQMIVTALGRRDVHQDTSGYYLDLSEADVDGAVFNKGDFKGTNFRRASMKGCRFHEAHLEGADLWNAHLEGADLRRAHLEGAGLRDVYLEGAGLRDVYLEGADLRDAHLERANLRDAHLEGADLRGAHLERANLTGADLKGADLRGTHFERADLTGADLKGADLRDAHLEEANLIGANPEEANLMGAHLEGVILGLPALMELIFRER